MLMGTQGLNIGYHVELSGGYFPQPEWRGEATSRRGICIAFIPGQGRTPAAVIKLDEPVTSEGITGDIAVLELRFAGADWDATETVHIELCDFVPDEKSWQYRRQGKWVEGAATYKVLTA